ncbi:MAG: hypothetical protein ACYSTG_04610 [Planctomycetota bacterium]|jgi:hypothetical protein
MDEKLNSLKGESLPALSGDFTEYAYASVWRVLRRRRWARRGRVAVIVAVIGCFAWLTSVSLPNVVLRKFLGKLPLEVLVAVHGELVPKRPCRSSLAPPLRQVLERSDVLVHAKVVDVTPNIGDIINDIVESQDVINRMLNREDVMLEGDIRVNLQLQVLKTHPPIDVKELVAIRRDTIGGVYYIKAGHEGIFALRRARKGIFGLHPLRKGTRLYNIAVEHGGIYLVDPKRDVVSGVPRAAKSLPLDKAWEFACDLYDSIHRDEKAKDVVRR